MASVFPAPMLGPRSSESKERMFPSNGRGVRSSSALDKEAACIHLQQGEGPTNSPEPSPSREAQPLLEMPDRYPGIPSPPLSKGVEVAPLDLELLARSSCAYYDHQTWRAALGFEGPEIAQR